MVEARLSKKTRKGDDGVENNIIRRKKKIRVDDIGVSVNLNLQKLFVTCHEVFKGPGTVPIQAHVKKMCHILDDMKPEDVGLSKNLGFFTPKTSGIDQGNPTVAYTTIYKSDKFSLCIFFLPAGAVIPLHNHPEMTVFSKLLLGRMHIKAYDWVHLNDSHISQFKSSSSTTKVRLARLKANQEFTAPCKTSVLYPTSGGNIHEFTAITPCAVLDVIGPPYSKDDGRDCSYYKDTPCTNFLNGEAKEDYAWLKEIEMPEDSEMDVIQYMGPQVFT